MKPRRTVRCFCFATALLGLLLAGCESVSESTPALYWELGTPVEEKQGVIVIYPNTSSDRVLELLGEPKRKETDKADPSKETWVYQRRVEFGYSYTESRLRDGGKAQVYSGRIYLETARIVFHAGRVADVKINRHREGIEPMSDFQRSLQGS